MSEWQEVNRRILVTSQVVIDICDHYLNGTEDSTEFLAIADRLEQLKKEEQEK